jgi:hypothetical protein
MGPIYKKFHLKRFLPELTLGQYPMPRIQIWHGAPMAAVVHAMAAILDNDSLSTAVVEPWIKEQLVQLKNLYSRKPAPRSRQPEREEKEPKLEPFTQAAEMPTPDVFTPSNSTSSITSPNSINAKPTVRNPIYIDNRAKVQLVMTNNYAASPSITSPQGSTPLQMSSSPFPSPISTSSSTTYYPQHPHSATAEPYPISLLPAPKVLSKSVNPFIGPIWPTTIPVGPSPIVWDSQRPSPLSVESRLPSHYFTNIPFSHFPTPNPALPLPSMLSPSSSSSATSPSQQSHPLTEETALLKMKMQRYAGKVQEEVLLAKGGVQTGMKRRLQNDESSKNIGFYDPIRESKSQWS